jgi:hypothetical protein
MFERGSELFVSTMINGALHARYLLQTETHSFESQVQTFHV